MPLTHTVLQRLAAIGVTSEFDLAHWRKLGDNPRITDDEYVRRLRAREAVGAEYRRLLPKLLSFAEARRRERPRLALADLANADQAKHHLLLTEMERFAASNEGKGFLTGLPNRASVVHTTRAGLLAAERAFVPSSAIVLEDTDWNHFIASVGRGDDGGEARWYASKWWLLSEHNRSDSGEADWHLTVGSSSCQGSFHEACSHYHWDGERYAFNEIYSSIDA
jgi:hypothetical protein